MSETTQNLLSEIPLHQARGHILGRFTQRGMAVFSTEDDSERKFWHNLYLKVLNHTASGDAPTCVGFRTCVEHWHLMLPEKEHPSLVGYAGAVEIDTNLGHVGLAWVPRAAYSNYFHRPWESDEEFSGVEMESIYYASNYRAVIAAKMFGGSFG